MNSRHMLVLGLALMISTLPTGDRPASAGDLIGPDLTLYRTATTQGEPAIAYNTLHDEYLVVGKFRAAPDTTSGPSAFPPPAVSSHSSPLQATARTGTRQMWPMTPFTINTSSSTPRTTYRPTRTSSAA